MSGYSASEMKECLWTLFDLGVCFLIEDAFWTCYTWVFCMLRENREVNSSFPKKEGWGSFLAIKIQRELKDEIPLHLFLHLANGHFSACVTDLAPFRSPPDCLSVLSKLGSWKPSASDYFAATGYGHMAWFPPILGTPSRLRRGSEQCKRWPRAGRLDHRQVNWTFWKAQRHSC